MAAGRALHHSSAAFPAALANDSAQHFALLHSAPACVARPVLGDQSLSLWLVCLVSNCLASSDARAAAADVRDAPLTLNLDPAGSMSEPDGVSDAFLDEDEEERSSLVASPPYRNKKRGTQGKAVSPSRPTDEIDTIDG
eukprot:CAMPEP_0119350586 /NCGR_PEP_ID=MMETSP1333-20130426/110134_1 /TAXON_ID=418940 /ORGANISM="Scyphosphaera apsteinii, Strain RCC1455" /LENGTH=138 /DNA_ID=CAMNT_0007363203 /DNA_START=703 /DNA_END=1120 /DNA_ORIENTATION=-